MNFQVFVNLSLVILVVAIRGSAAEKAEAADEECRTGRCTHHGPEIRFPFQLKEWQPERCGLPGFRVSCYRGKTMLHIQYLANTTLPGIQLLLSKEQSIRSINYKSQEIELDPYDFTNTLKLVSTSISTQSTTVPPFEGLDLEGSSASFVSCSSRVDGQSDVLPVVLTSLRGQAFPVYYLQAYISSDVPIITSCTKIFSSSLPTGLLAGRFSLTISWSTPNCGICEAKGKYCKLTNNGTSTICLSKVKVLKSDPKANGEDFINEVSTIGQIYHVNVVRLVGYCADGCNRALVYEFQPNSSLEKFTYSGKSDQYNFLGWEKMQEIALGIAKGIEYLHQGCAQQILHFDIKPHNILLDQNFNPKISDFGLAKLCSKDESIVSMTMARGTIGYIAPEVFSRNFGKVSSKSDVYSFGMLLLEMVGARNNTTAGNNTETYFPEWIFHRLEGGEEAAIQIEEEADSNIAKKLTIIGLWCIGWHPVDRPAMKRVIQMLESEECPAMPPNPFTSSKVKKYTNDLEVISESE
ncbi:LEAF RUST 10 DISEASE-RESISTANCE LOCUS RECEPTOR-LIKE PROTEIN KINASE-like 2.4 isoform X3 [Apium graveolens]|uniref:LEAF RUST 10 DISEASE-RESISTANCE LOCUS RECEPTOR-LIKE PROTEIN KINASE-like 2.4 isoform X3 n=1 Tax=Apium graveolens TaxID=4045 RepID=UPI003D7B1354